MKVHEATKNRVTFTSVQGGHIHETEEAGAYTPAKRRGLLAAIERDRRTAQAADQLMQRVNTSEGLAA